MAYPTRMWCSTRLALHTQLQRTISQAALRRTSPLPSLFAPPSNTRALHTSPSTHRSPKSVAALRSKDRGPASQEPTQTDFGRMNVLGDIPPPASAIDNCTNDGFVLSNGVMVKDGGVVLIGGEVFKWAPWVRKNGGKGEGLVNEKGLWEVPEGSLGILDVLWPKPDLLVIGTGAATQILSPEMRKVINEMGIRVEVSDTRNAAAQYNLLATERGVNEVGALLLPISWKPTK